MSDATSARGFPQIPEHATDAELSGLFRLLEESDRLDSPNLTTHRAVDSDAPAERMPPAPSSRHRPGCYALDNPPKPCDCDARLFNAPTSRAFAAMARAVAAELNR